MRSHTDATVTIQTSAESVLSPPSWFGEVAELVMIPAFISFCSGMLSLISLAGSQHVCQPGRSPDRMRELVPRA